MERIIRCHGEGGLMICQNNLQNSFGHLFPAGKTQHF